MFLVIDSETRMSRQQDRSRGRSWRATLREAVEEIVNSSSSRTIGSDVPDALNDDDDPDGGRRMRMRVEMPRTLLSSLSSRTLPVLGWQAVRTVLPFVILWVRPRLLVVNV